MLNRKSAPGFARVASASTVIATLAVAEAVAFSTRNVTLKMPAWFHVCVDFGPVANVPSPNSQVHAVGWPLDVSVKVTGWPILTDRAL